MKGNVLVAMSGGVDSSAAAWLLTEAGYGVAGITMCLGLREGDDKTRCCGKEAIDDARRVCDRLKIPHHVVDFASELEKHVIEKFISEYLRGRTPNPCVDCNRFLKFDILLDLARAMGFEYLATGHYARIVGIGGDYHLLKARDESKDQTYFLYPIAAEDLPAILFPLGDMTKSEVRTLARKTGLPVAEKAESQDICFVTNGDYRDFIIHERHIPPGESGDIVTRDGKVLGRHRGLLFYTIGQRSGLGISAKTPLYVVDMDVAGNRIIVGHKEDLRSGGLWVGELNLLTAQLPEEADAKIRYRKKPARCRMTIENGRLRMLFSEPQESITPGQAVVLYEGDRVLGGGVIEEVIHGTH